MSTLTNDCQECGRPFARNIDHWKREPGSLCGTNIVSFQSAVDSCLNHTIERLKTRVTELEQQLSSRLRIWELSGGDVWCVALTEDECWGYLEEQHGNTDEVAELKADGDGWSALPDDKKISLYVDSDGDVCGFDDGAPCNMPCWVWAVRHGAGFLGETVGAVRVRVPDGAALVWPVPGRAALDLHHGRHIASGWAGHECMVSDPAPSNGGRMKREVLADCEEQIRRWVAGESLHSDHRWLGEECCPDFSCCRPKLLQPVEVREAYQAADARGREKLCMAFLGGMLSESMPDVRAYITNGDPEIES